MLLFVTLALAAEPDPATVSPLLLERHQDRDDQIRGVRSLTLKVAAAVAVCGGLEWGVMQLPLGSSIGPDPGQTEFTLGMVGAGATLALGSVIGAGIALGNEEHRYESAAAERNAVSATLTIGPGAVGIRGTF